MQSYRARRYRFGQKFGNYTLHEVEDPLTQRTVWMQSHNRSPDAHWPVRVKRDWRRNVYSEDGVESIVFEDGRDMLMVGPADAEPMMLIASWMGTVQDGYESKRVPRWQQMLFDPLVVAKCAAGRRASRGVANTL